MSADHSVRGEVKRRASERDPRTTTNERTEIVREETWKRSVISGCVLPRKFKDPLPTLVGCEVLELIGVRREPKMMVPYSHAERFEVSANDARRLPKWQVIVIVRRRFKRSAAREILHIAMQHALGVPTHAVLVKVDIA